MATAAQIISFKAKFPVFVSTPDADVGNVLDAATVWIDSSLWSMTDYNLAVVYLAAHFLVLLEQEQAAAGVGGVGEIDLYIKSISFGERRVQFAQRQEASLNSELGPADAMLATTIYGQWFLALRARNIIPAAIV